MIPKNMTIKDIARESGYSVSTVSRVLNNHPDVSEGAKEAVARVVEQNRFVLNSMARLLKQQQSTNILIIVKGTMNIFFTKIVEKMQHLISVHGYNAVVHYIDEDDDEVRLAGQLCRERKSLGLIFLGGNIEHFKQGFDQIDQPAVLTTTLTDELTFDHLSLVGINDADAAQMAIDYLLDHGHRQIGIIGGHTKSSYISKQRFTGCRNSFTAHGLDFDASQYQKANFHLDSAYRAAKELMARKPDLTALFCMSDVMAIGAMRALTELGKKIPQDVSVIGFDGIELGRYYNPQLTTIAQPQMELAEESVNLLIDHIEQQSKARTIILNVGLTEGESVRMIEH
ncbi:MAG: LacI family DNA-binding transcriptional regulator [Clostridiaceae bacterium]|nr:LacI family DNA-binding transcriptional regulator [Clostridiaceae bacterium]